ncbi:sulfate/molybdate ABC transporter ATP-binding protein [Amphibiibacter pelophylacis]|uniref:Sulfate ABC transporter ATP-binding protein n=1 Tax=Amphibiibacter pelophylacis TaxID=1799477 RepID=A0ACC6NYP5_9BURK
MSIQLHQIHKRFGAFQALGGIDLDVASSELLALLGPSGCGKTTLLRIIAGLEAQDSGQIRFDGQDISHVPVRERGVGFVFQHYALFRHMSVADNIAFGLRVRERALRPAENVIADRVNSLLHMVQLDGLGRRFPGQLSGGQRQRVALARALATDPRVLLLDEPFGALDAKVRKELRRWLRQLHDDLHITSVFVTHDQEEALEVADRVVLMNRGRIEQNGTPQQVWDEPASPFVCGFLGDINVFAGQVRGGRVHLRGVLSQALALDAPPEVATEGSAASVYVRPHQIRLARWREGDPGIVAQVCHAIVTGPLARLELSPLLPGSTPASGGDALQSDMRADLIEVHLPAGEFAALNLQHGDRVTALPLSSRIYAGAPPT